MIIEIKEVEEFSTIIEKLDMVLEKLNTNTFDRWMDTLEVAKYLRYSKSSIDKMVSNNNFIEGIHYHQKINKRFFDREKIDMWVLQGTNELTNKIIDNIFKNTPLDVAA